MKSQCSTSHKYLHILIHVVESCHEFVMFVSYLTVKVLKWHKLQCNFQVQVQANDGEGYEVHPAYQMVEPNKTSVSAVYPG